MGQGDYPPTVPALPKGSAGAAFYGLRKNAGRSLFGHGILFVDMMLPNGAVGGINLLSV